MAAAGRAMPYSRRSLIECCAAAGLPDMDWHTARDDAMAAAMLLAHLLRGFPQAVRLTDDHRQAAAWSWSVLPCGVVAPVKRTPLGHVEPHFLARLVDRIPRTGDPVADAYLAMLDDALLDRQICATEADALLDLAHGMGLHKADVIDMHHQYLRELAHVVWADGILAVDERRDMGHRRRPPRARPGDRRGGTTGRAGRWDDEAISTLLSATGCSWRTGTPARRQGGPHRDDETWTCRDRRPSHRGWVAAGQLGQPEGQRGRRRRPGLAFREGQGRPRVWRSGRQRTYLHAGPGEHEGIAAAHLSTRIYRSQDFTLP